MNYADGVVYSVPNQSMPGLLDFTLNFHLSNLYCDMELEDTYVEIMWRDSHEFSARPLQKKI